MQVIISGYNKTIDNETPEIISASYARISRSPKSIPEIRNDAKSDVEGARASNNNIVFGIGHSSIAEHVVFNIDIIGVSRFLVEEIESHRLCSYTEKSQRYVLFNNDYVIPEELFGDNKEQYINLAEEQFKFYKTSYPIVLEYFKNTYPGKYKSDPKTVEGCAKEDCRYILPLATKTQLGMTISARNLELMIRRLKAYPFVEFNELAEKLYSEAKKIAPSLFPYIEPSILEKRRININYIHQIMNDRMVKLVHHTTNSDEKLSNMFYEGRDIEEKILNSLYGMKSFDSAPREFEIVDFEFEVNVSASCYAQLKRHRLMTLIPRPYTKNTNIPESIIFSADLESEFIKLVEKVNNFTDELEYLYPYILTNSHVRSCYLKINLRELYHFCRMRMDNHAQWEIRKLAIDMAKYARNVAPIGMVFCCGKDVFDSVYKEVL